ncbi:hypothetical protein, partial [Polynucleobacter sp.]|uniref:hypothetical protein n=1 Tax=Polynucleobacter sp. TaxID=2029855 RepID=UPI0025E96173
VRLQSQSPEHGLGRFHTKAAVGHGRLTLLLIPLKKGRITYEVLGVSDSLSQEMINIRETYAQGLDNYYHGQWDLAERAFFACLQSCSADGPSKAMLSRISFLKASSSINTWNGIWKMENK